MSEEADSRSMIAEWAKKGVKYGPCGRMCDDCAFKAGTEANSDEYTAEVAANCAAYEMSVFRCHAMDGPGFMVLDETCAGYMYARQYLSKMPFKP
jgi:hypothetical protein